MHDLGVFYQISVTTRFMFDARQHLITTDLVVNCSYQSKRLSHMINTDLCMGMHLHL